MIKGGRTLSSETSRRPRGPLRRMILMENALFDRPLESLCAALAESFGIAAPSAAAAPDERLTAYVREKTGGKGVDRLFLYNPDAVADWIYRKYADFCAEAVQAAPLELGYRTVMPSVSISSGLNLPSLLRST